MHMVDRLDSSVRSRRGGAAVQRARRSTSAAHAPASAPSTHSALITDSVRGAELAPGSRTCVEISLPTITEHGHQNDKSPKKLRRAKQLFHGKIDEYLTEAFLKLRMIV